jgi:glycosyltransferase involved in cell wall biosynthesis
VVFTERDRRVLTKQHPQVPVVRIPFGAEIPKYPLDPAGGEPLNILFVGSFLHLPNIDAAIRLIDNIFPAVLAHFPEACLYIVGSHPPAVVQSRANEHVIVTGFVPDVEPYLDQATLVAAPLRLGGGMRVKVLEALAAGKAIVASHLAIEGLDLVNGEQVILAETDQEFCRAMIDLFNKPEKRLSIADSARNWVCSHLSWEETIVAYEQLYQSLIAGQEFSENRALHPIKHSNG